jgi:hypothetical protein
VEDINAIVDKLSGLGTPVHTVLGVSKVGQGLGDLLRTL